MPRYAYECACGHTTLKVWPMTFIPKIGVCSACAGVAKRVFSAPQIAVSSQLSEANTRGLAEMDATRKADEKVYDRNWSRRLQSL